MGGRVALICVLVGCNQIYGLDETSVGTDRDDDGVFDGDDNCGDIANAEQRDGDGDGFGDACDGCPDLPTATNHDEDGDNTGDDCDLCPGQAEFQDDADRDGIGDLCDVTGSTNTMRRLFDPFVTLSPDWQTSGAAWRVEKDTVVPSADARIDGLRATHIRTADRSWSINIGVRSQVRWRTDDVVGVVLLDMAGNVKASCKLDCKTDAPNCKLVAAGTALSSTGVLVDPQPFVSLSFRGQTEATQATFACGVVGGAEQSIPNVGAGNNSVGTPALLATTNFAITYFESLD